MAWSHSSSSPTLVSPSLPWRLLAGLLAISATVAGCGDNQQPEQAAALYRELQAMDYRSWPRAPGYQARRTSRAPHGGAVEIYVNDVVADALAQGVPEQAWPVGSLIVKDGFDGSELELVAVMDKREDGWFWAEYDDEGDADYSGKPGLCIDCHRAGSDFVRAFGFAGP